MVSLTALVIPIVLSAVIVFIASSILHMVLPYHHSDLKKVPREDEVQAALRPFNIPPGDYALPCGSGPSDMKNAAFLDKLNKGPVAFMTVVAPGPRPMGTALVLWLIYSIVISLFAGYIASRALGPGAPYLSVFRFVGASAFMGYSLGMVHMSIWYSRSWTTTLKDVVDGLIYGLLTAGTFGWLWPH